MYEIGEESVEVVAVEVTRVVPVELDVTADPGGVGLLGTDGVVADPELGADAVHEAPGAPWRCRGELLHTAHEGKWSVNELSKVVKFADREGVRGDKT